MDPSDFVSPTYANGSFILCPFQDPDVPGGLPLVVTIHSISTLLSFCVVVVNVFIAWSLWSRRMFHRSGRSSTLFVLNLVLSAGLGGFLALTDAITDTVCQLVRLRSELLCVLKVLSTLLQWMVTVNMHALIAIDRYLLIVHSLRYALLMTKRRALLMIGSAWLLAVVASLTVLLDNEWRPGVRCIAHDLVRLWHVLAVQLPVNGVVLVIVVVTHVRIRREARRSEERHHSGPGDWIRFSNKSARVLTLVVGCYLLSSAPTQAVLVLQAFGLLSDNALFLSAVAVSPVCVLSLLVNPLLYTWKNAQLRRDLLCSWCSVTMWAKQSFLCVNQTSIHPPVRCKQRF